MGQSQTSDLELKALRLASLIQSPELETELAALSQTDHFQHVFSSAIRECVGNNRIRDAHVLWDTSKSLDFATARGIATAHILSNAGHVEDAKEILGTVNRAQINSQQLRSRYAKTLLLTGNTTEALDMLQGLVQENESGFGMTNGIVHELISTQRLELARNVWNLMRNEPSKKGNIHKALITLTKKFGKHPFEKPQNPDAKASAKETIDFPKATFDEDWLSGWQNLLKTPKEQVLLAAVSVAHIAPPGWGERLWELILKADPSRAEIYYRYRIKSQASSDSVEIDHEVLVSDLSTITKILPTGDKPLTDSDFATLKQFALLAGHHGKEVLQSFERLCEILMRNRFLDVNRRDRLRILMQHSAKFFSTTNSEESPANFVRSTSFKRLQACPPKVMTFQNEQTRRALTNSPDSDSARKGKPKKKRHR